MVRKIVSSDVLFRFVLSFSFKTRTWIINVINKYKQLHTIEKTLMTQQNPCDLYLGNIILKKNFSDIYLRNIVWKNTQTETKRLPIHLKN